jgi:DNA polymerase alpha subunit A
VRTEREVKGLDMVRRDWCVLSREFGSTVLDALLSGKEREEIVDSVHTALTTLGEDMRAGRVPVDKYVITKGLNKAPGDYPDAKGQPHLQVQCKASRRWVLS